MRGAIFDMDGLLIDSERIWQRVWHEIAAERGCTLPEDFPAQVCGTGGTQTRVVLRRSYPGEDPEEVLRTCSARVHALQEAGVPLLPGAETILRGVKSLGYRVAVASSSPMDLIEQNLKRDGVMDCFDVLTAGKEAKNGKPAPDVFLLAAERLGLPAEDCWVFEDSRVGVEAGWRAGCRVVMVPNLVPADDRAREMAFAVCRDLNEAWDVVRRAEGQP